MRNFQIITIIHRKNTHTLSASELLLLLLLLSWCLIHSRGKYYWAASCTQHIWYFIFLFHSTRCCSSQCIVALRSKRKIDCVFCFSMTERLSEWVNVRKKLEKDRRRREIFFQNDRVKKKFFWKWKNKKNVVIAFQEVSQHSSETRRWRDHAFRFLRFSHLGLELLF